MRRYPVKYAPLVALALATGVWAAATTMVPVATFSALLPGTALPAQWAPLETTGITTHNRHLQKGLDPKHKAVRVANYAKNIAYEVGIITHSCGVREPRELQRMHARVVTANGLSVALNELHPDRATVASDA